MARESHHLPAIGETATSGLDRTASAMPHLTWRELMTSRAMARRAGARGRNRGRSEALRARIEAEIERRRLFRRDRLHASVPRIPGLD